MASRKTINVVERTPADPGASPNEFIGQITVDMRVAFPPHTPTQDLDAAIVAASNKLRAQIWQETDR